jgi:hypothetical protein
MDPTGKTFPSEDPRKWIGRILMAVILGEAIWNLIVSIMNNLVVPWLGDLFGQSSGLPTSFTQRPYNYPDLFVSFLEFCIAGLVAAIINYFFQRPRAVRVKPGKSPVLVPPVEPVRLVPRTEAPAPQPQMVPAPATTAQPAPTPPTLTKSAPTAPVVKPDPIIPAAPVIAAPPKPVPVVAPTPIAKPSPVAPVPPPVAASVPKPQPAPPKAEPAKPKKSKEVYYNIVGEPMPSDED